MVHEEDGNDGDSGNVLQIRRQRRQLGIQVWGADVPAPLEKFSQVSCFVEDLMMEQL